MIHAKSNNKLLSFIYFIKNKLKVLFLEVDQITINKRCSKLLSVKYASAFFCLILHFPNLYVVADPLSKHGYVLCSCVTYIDLDTNKEIN